MLHEVSLKEEHKKILENVLQVKKNNEGQIRKINRIRKIKIEDNYN